MSAALLRPLPLGSSSFVLLRQNNQIYVDKTALLYALCCHRAKIFIARPRRFGKSLLLSTIESLFKDGLQYFEDLAIASKWTDKTYTVFRLDFSLAKDFTTISEFAKYFEYMLEDAAKRAGLTVPNKGEDPFARFASLISTLPVSSLVLLIDEYDAPLTAHLGDPILFEAIQRTLSRFYAVLKTYDEVFRFFFMTGITKLSNTGIFSSFNDLTDISSNSLYGTLLGLTEDEIEFYFSDYLNRAANILHTDRAAIKAQLRANYNGFCFDEKVSTSVYCPWSVLNFFAAPDRGFQNYWYQSGGQANVLMQYLRSHKLENPAKYNQPIGLGWNDLRAFEQKGISLEVLLVQCGYLTIKRALSPDFVEVGYPNPEVSRSMAGLYTDELLRNADRISIGFYNIASILANGSLDDAIDIFNRTFNVLDYNRYPVTNEATCRAFLQVLLIGAGLSPSVETHSALGRSDIEVEAGDRHWVFEIKFARTPSEVERLIGAFPIQHEVLGGVQPIARSAERCAMVSLL